MRKDTAPGPRFPDPAEVAVNDAELARRVDAHEAAALADIVKALPAEVAEAFGAEIHTIDGATAPLLAATDSAFFNRVIGLGVFRPASRGGVERIAGLYKERGTTFMVHVNPYAAPSAIPRWLAEAGLSAEPDWVTIARGAEPAGPVDTGAFRIEPALDHQADLFATTLCGGYGMPDEWAPLWRGIVGRERWMNWLLWDGDVAAATGSLFVDDGQARLCNGTTLPSYRRRGIHQLFLRYRIRAGLAAGCTLFTGETWKGGAERVNPARRSHARNEIRTAYVRRNYLFRA